MAKKEGRGAPIEPTVPLGTYDKYDDKRICDQDLIDHKVEPPTGGEVDLMMKHTMLNLGAYYKRMQEAGAILDSAVASGHREQEAQKLYDARLDDLLQVQGRMDELLEECFVTYRQKEGSILHVERSPLDPTDVN